MPLPTPQQFAESLSTLLGVEIEATASDPIVWNSQDAFTAADYHTQERTVGAAAVVDVKAVAYLGSCLTLTPQRNAEQMVDGRTIEPQAYEAFCEVMNILAGLLNDVDPVHVKLREVFPDRRKVNDALKKVVAKPSCVVAFDLEIPKYGTAKVNFFRP
ncbi:MAG: hypothetical protein KDK78_03070 [Chlamydiia bacterium]|nr:hypothetical protein [Chlamydiia bacterium]